MGAIKIHQDTIEPGENKIVSLNTYELPTKTKIEIPIHVFRSKQAGPTVLFSAGMHGDEINGIEVLRKIITRKEIQNLLCGTLIAIPVMNTVSFLYQKRDLPDGRDLNRCFPGTKNGSLGGRIAYDLMKEVIPLIDVGVDFHTGGAKINNYPQIRCTFEDKASLETAKMFSPPLIVNSVYRDGTLRKEAFKKDKPILVFEGGESLRFDYQSINEGINGCLRLLNHYKMLDQEVPPNPFVKLKKSAWVRAKQSGLFHISMPNGAYVNKDEILGAICNPFGQVEARITSPFDGYIVGVNNHPVVNQGDALIHIGTED